MDTLDDTFDDKVTFPPVYKRFLAGLIDYGIIWAITGLYIFSFGELTEDGSYSVTGFKALLPVVIWFVLTVVIEQIQGATLGNSFLKIYPIPMSRSSDELSFQQSLIRHLLDPIDMAFFGLVGFLVMGNSEMNQRIGDLAADTVVIEE